MSRRRPPEDDDYWMQSFADLVSLLLGFFVVLVSISVTDTERYKEVAESIGEAMRGAKKEQVAPQAQPQANTEDTYAELAAAARRHIVEQGLESQVRVRQVSLGVEITAAGSLLFAPGSADLSDRAKRLLDTIAGLLVTRRLSVKVEGHTDDTPIRSSLYPTNWELSAARATSVVRFLIERGVVPGRLVAQGFADTQPAEPPSQSADPAAARAKNRRVVLVIGEPAER